MAKGLRLQHPDISARIKALRVGLGYSQRDIAASGYSYAYISRIEAGTRRPSIEALVGIADKLGTTALHLLTGDRNGHCPVCQRGHSNGHGTIDIPLRDAQHLVR